MRAGIYARISLDRQDGEGVARQLADCRALAEELGWEVAGEYVDNDVSAYSGKVRPDYRRMIADLERGHIEGVLSYHTDRLYRQRKDLAEFVDVVKATNAQVRTVKSGEVDLSTASGRLIAAQLGAIGIYESERMGERVSRAKRERALQGRPPGGGLRAFGYEADKMTVRPDEADLIRASARRVAMGGSIWAEAKAWNAAGVLTTAGNPWEVSAVRRVLSSPRIAGVRTYRGEEVGQAAWPALIDRDTHDRIVLLAARRRRGRPNNPAWLLTALIECPKCGRVMYGSSNKGFRSYACSTPAVAGRGCGGASVSAAATDRKVVGLVAAWLADPPDAMQQWAEMRGRSRDHLAEVDAITSTRKELTRRFAAGDLEADEYDEGRAVLTARLEAIEDQVVPAAPPLALVDVAAAWERATTAERRPLIEALVVTPMTLSPDRMADPADRLTVVPRWDV